MTTATIKSILRRAAAAAALVAVTLVPALAAHPRTPVKIGLIETVADASWGVLNDVTVIQQSFVPAGSRPALWKTDGGISHGTVTAATTAAAFRALDGETPVEIYIATPFFDRSSGSLVNFDKDPSRFSISRQGLMAAYRWFKDNGVTVVGTTFVGNDTQLMRETTRYAVSLGITLFASAGNSIEQKSLFPAAYPETIAISGLDKGLNWSANSGKGEFVDFSAAQTGVPGAEVPAAKGTSFSTAYAVGIAAWLADLAGTSDHQALELALKSVAIDRGDPGHDSRYGYGALTIDAARIRAGTAIALARENQRATLNGR